MAQDSIISGLFGLTPEMYQRSQAEADQKAAMQFAQLSPLQQASAGFYSAGMGLGGGIGTLLGAEDPQLRMIAKQQEILSGIDQTDPKSIAEGAKRASEMGIPRLANALSDLYRKTLESGALVAQREATARKERIQQTPTSIQEAQYISALKQNLEKFKALPEGTEGRSGAIAGITAQLSALEKPEKIPSFGAEAERVSRELYGKSFSELTQAQMKAVNARVEKKSTGEEIGEGIAKGFERFGKALGYGLKAEGTKEGEFSAKNMDELGGAVAAGVSSKRNLDTLNSALKTAFTGTLSDTKTSVVKALDGIGLPVGDDLKKAASSTELLNAMSTRYVFPLVKNFPGSLAAKELDRLEKTAPTALQQPETIARLVNLLRTDISENEYTYNKAKEYRSQKKSLIGFNQADQKIEFQNKFNRLQTLYDTVKSRGGKGTLAEGEEINSLKRELGVK